MTDEQRQWFATMESLFEHPGWALFIDNVEGWKDAINKSWQGINPEWLRHEQGRANSLDQVINFAPFIETLKAQALEDEI